MSKKTKALLFNFISFAALFLVARFGIGYFVGDSSVFLSIGAAVLAMVLAPKFKAIKAKGEVEKLYMNWIFIKGVKEI